MRENLGEREKERERERRGGGENWASHFNILKLETHSPSLGDLLQKILVDIIIFV